MRFYTLRNTALALSLLAVTIFEISTTAVAIAQTSVTGALSGVVEDSTGAVVPGASVVITDTATDAKQTVITNQDGRYVIGQLRPGVYKLSAAASGMQSETVQATVLLGATLPVDIKVTPTADKMTVEVTASTLPLVDAENIALATTFNEEQLQRLPTPGGDVTTYAFTAPGVVVNAGGTYGNFSSDGIPAISNLFVLNGFDNQDPFLNLNNSGSSNLSLGQGELADVTVVQNGYNSQYGRAAGAIINYTTKSGGNAYHGEAVYDYNGTVLNANGWFNNFSGGPRPHAVSNEWALNGGGPIVKDKLFFFSDYEGLHYVLPASGFVSLPSSQYEAYALKTVPAAAVATYQQMFDLYNNAPSHGSATPSALGGKLNGGCGDLAGTAAPGGGTFGSSIPCTLSAFASANNINIEWLFTQRVDWNVSDKQKIWGRYKMDHGSQPTNTSYINPAFNTVSIQPEYEGQFNDTYTFTPTLINSAIVAANWYTAYFGPANIAAAQGVLPFWAVFANGADGSGTAQLGGLTNLGAPGYFPEGRNVTQYQLEDDLSWTRGRHSFRFGGNFRRDLVSDFDGQQYTDFPFLLVQSLQDIALGAFTPAAKYYQHGDQLQQAFVSTPTAHLALYNFGGYVQDEWQIMPRLKLTVGARFDRTGSPLCHQECFSLYTGAFPSSSASLTTPYASEINPSNSHPFGVDAIYFQPRVGVNYQLDEHTVIRTGAGLFSDLYPAGFLDGPVQNFPNYNLETIVSGVIATGGSGSLLANAASSNTAIQRGFSSGTATSLNKTLTAMGVPFTPPGLNAYFGGKFHEPQYVEFSLQIQRQLSKSDGISLTYAGNYGYNELIQNPYLNASSGAFNNSTGTWAQQAPFAGLSATPPDPSFGEVNGYTNAAHSNYNGTSVTYTHQGQGITGHLSYTYSHSLDTISNGGVGEFYNWGSVTKQVTPSLSNDNLNYSNTDYDIRNNLVGDLVYHEPFKVQNPILNQVVSGWLVSAKTYYRSGEPFTINNNGTIAGFITMGAINNPQGLTSLMPQALTGQLTNTCASNPHGGVTQPCLNATEYVPGGSQATFGNVRRNAFFGPHYANTDATLSKQMFKRETVAFEVGAQAFNVFNHANFANPGSVFQGDNSNQITSPGFGSIIGVVAPPTSPYGSFQSAAVTQRILVVTGRFTF